MASCAPPDGPDAPSEVAVAKSPLLETPAEDHISAAATAILVQAGSDVTGPIELQVSNTSPYPIVVSASLSCRAFLGEAASVPLSPDSASIEPGATATFELSKDDLPLQPISGAGWLEARADVSFVDASGKAQQRTVLSPESLFRFSPDYSKVSIFSLSDLVEKDGGVIAESASDLGAAVVGKVRQPDGSFRELKGLDIQKTVSGSTGKGSLVITSARVVLKKDDE